MRKVVVFDSGYGGELFADKLAEEIPILEIIRVIDWRNAENILKSPRKARKVAEAALRPYIGEVDLIILANQLLTITSLKYFKKKYKNQAFLGLGLESPKSTKRTTLILTTKATSKTIPYHYFLLKLKSKTTTLCFDTWPDLIDDGIITEKDIHEAAEEYYTNTKEKPDSIVLACSHFSNIKEELRRLFGNSAKIYDDIENTIRKTCKILRLRGVSKLKS